METVLDRQDKWVELKELLQEEEQWDKDLLVRRQIKNHVDNKEIKLEIK